MRHKSYGEIKSNNKRRIAELAGTMPDTRAAERFKEPAYQVGRLLRNQEQRGGRTLGDLLDYLWDGFSTGRMRGSDPVPDDVMEYIYGGHPDAVEYLAEKYNIKERVDAGGQKNT